MSEKKNQYNLTAEINHSGIMKTKKIEVNSPNTDIIRMELYKIIDNVIIMNCDFIQITILNQKLK